MSAHGVAIKSRTIRICGRHVALRFVGVWRLGDNLKGLEHAETQMLLSSIAIRHMNQNGLI